MKLCLSCHLEFNDDTEICPKDNVALVPIGDDPLIGTVLQGRYKIESVIGRGAMGMVYKASQELIGRGVAVKVLHPHLAADNEAIKRFHQQARAASRLNHPHIITLFDYGVMAGGQPYIVMDLLEGISLAHLLEEREYLPVDEAASIIKQICDALSDAHKHAVVHRDIKPDNIILEQTNTQKDWVKVVDFGIAKIIQGGEETLLRITATGMVCGSPAYMSPEQFRGHEVDHRTDIYSLAVVIFEMLTGRLPFLAKDLVTLMSMHCSESPPKLVAVRPDLRFGPGLEKAIARALGKRPEERPQTMDLFWEELEAGLSEHEAAAGSGQASEYAPSFASAGKAGSHGSIQEAVTAQLAAKNRQLEEEIQKWVKSSLSNEPSAQSITQRMPRTRAAVPFSARVIGLLQRSLPYAVTMVLVTALLWFARGQQPVGRFVDARLKPMLPSLLTAGGDPSALYAAGKLEPAMDILEARKGQGKLSHTDAELLNKIYMQLADRQAQKRSYRQAVSLLSRVTGRNVPRARQLMRRYRKMIK